MTPNEIGTKIIQTAFEIHKELGPGLFESVYEAVLANELQNQNFAIKRQLAVPIRYRNQCFEEGFRADILVNDCVVIELKSVERVLPIHSKQLLTYLKLLKMPLGYVLNFGGALMKDGIVRLVNGLE